MRLQSLLIDANQPMDHLDLKNLKLPSFVKPVDSSGGKGITLINRLDQLQAAIEYAKKFSYSKKVILENKIYTNGLQICGDGFVKDGKVCFLGLGNNFFLKNLYAPFAEVFLPLKNRLQKY